MIIDCAAKSLASQPATCRSIAVALPPLAIQPPTFNCWHYNLQHQRLRPTFGQPASTPLAPPSFRPSTSQPSAEFDPSTSQPSAEGLCRQDSLPSLRYVADLCGALGGAGRGKVTLSVVGPGCCVRCLRQPAHFYIQQALLARVAVGARTPIIQSILLRGLVQVGLVAVAAVAAPL